MDQLICSYCGKPIKNSYKVCSICKRSYHINHSCPEHPTAPHNTFSGIPTIPSESNNFSNQRSSSPPPSIQFPQPVQSHSQNIPLSRSRRNIPLILILLMLLCLCLIPFNKLGTNSKMNILQTTPTLTKGTTQPIKKTSQPTQKISGSEEKNTRNSLDNFVCPNTLEPRLMIDGDAVVTSVAANNLRLRFSAGIGSERITSVPEGTILDVIDGPICMDGYVWWKVETTNGLTGWAAESDKEVYYLKPR